MDPPMTCAHPDSCVRVDRSVGGDQVGIDMLSGVLPLNLRKGSADEAEAAMMALHTGPGCRAAHARERQALCAAPWVLTTWRTS